MFVTLSGIVTLVSPRQPENEYCPMLVTLSGIAMLAKLVQLLNAPGPISVTPSKMVTAVIDWYAAGNTEDRLSAQTHCGTVISRSPLQPENAEEPMFVTLFWIVTLVRLVQL